MLRNVKSRVDTSSPRSCARLNSPAMSQSEKAFKKSTAQDIRKRFKNVLHFPKRNKNPPTPSSPTPNTHFEEVSDGSMYTENGPCTPTGQAIPRPTTRRNPHITPTVQPFTIRSYASEPHKNPKSCQHSCLHHRHSIIKTEPDRRVSQNQQCQHKCVIHAHPKTKVHIEQNTTETHFNQEYENNNNFTKSRIYMEADDLPKSRVYIEQNAIDSRYHSRPDNHLKSKTYTMEPSGDVSKSKVYILEQNDVKEDFDVTKNQDMNDNNTPAKQNSEKFEKPTDNRNADRNIGAKSFTQRSSEEHEYLMFLLRITEDIIVNDFYSNDDIKNIFERHIEENKSHLEYRKMVYHLSNLCRELNINCKEYSNFEFGNQFESPRESRCVFDRSIFRNCKRCINLPMTPKFFTNQNDRKMPDNASDNESISPNTVKISEKFSLGRVTECTEPIASTSTLNTPKIIEMVETIPEVNEQVSRKFEFMEKGFEYEQHYIKEKMLEKEREGQGNAKNSFKSFQTNLKNQNLVVENFQVNTVDSPKNQNMDFYLNLDFQDNTTSQENSEDSFQITLKRPNNDFAKLSLDEVWSNTKNLVNQVTFDKNNQPSSMYCNVSIKNNENISSDKNAESSEPVSMVEYLAENIQPTEDQSNTAPSQEKNFAQSLSSKSDEHLDYVDSNFLQTEYDQAKNIEENISNILNRLTAKTKKECEQNNEIIDLFRNSKKKVVEISPVPDSSRSNCKNPMLSFIESVKNNDKSLVTNQQNTEGIQDNKKESMIKVYLEGSPKESDYIYLKGPVYVLKALLDVQPQLIILQEETKNESSETNNCTRPNSTDSLESNKTYTVMNHITTEELEINIIEQLDMIDFKDIHSSAENDESKEGLQKEFAKKVEFLKKPSDTYNLAYSDYDLTPEKEYTDKYHNLLVDATTSVTKIDSQRQAKHKQQSELKFVHEKSETNFPKSENPREVLSKIEQSNLFTENNQEIPKIEKKNPSIKENMFWQNDSDINIDNNCSVVVDSVLNQLRSKFGGSDKSLAISTASSYDNLQKPTDFNKIIEASKISSHYTKENNISQTSLIELSNSTTTAISQVTESLSSGYFINKLEEIGSREIIEKNKDSDLNYQEKRQDMLDLSECLEYISVNDESDDNNCVDLKLYVKDSAMELGQSEESNLETIVNNNMYQGDVKDGDRLIRNMRESIGIINQKLESDLEGNNEIMPRLERDVPIPNKNQINDRQKASRSEVALSKLFRMRDVFLTQRSMSATSADVVCNKSF